ncbi:alpha/beta hydrolase [Hyphomonas johnsonii]|uniref:Palmitoyl-protein thioesterase ABHD10, mitochondrial n=1 Tax=Hyphomonas johnsonii MHS-2 TaxID=1280950 RepID=A0A059FQN9_9PROT|nr:alpha/beta hydrolase [Hyphomonas johnsonii]KCZ92778.1 alpha/beta fold family hydrolase [Hyphomonas johnsonii MHS-2]
MTTSNFTSPEGRRLAYRRNDASPGKLTFVWLSGFKSDMTGTKVKRVEAWANQAGYGFLAFDYSGHGESAGAFEDGTVSQWRADTLAAIDSLTEGPLVLVGSSMGGWLAILAATARPARVKGLVLIAPAPDFTQKLMWPEFAPEAQAEIRDIGFTLRPSDYGEPYKITQALIEDGRQWQVLDAPIPFPGPVRILQGMQDPDVPYAHAFRLVGTMTSDDLTFTLIKDGDHRLSREQDIARLLATCGEIARTLGA